MFAVSTLSMLAEPIPRSVALTTWVNSWLDGASSADSVIAALECFGSHRVLAPEQDPAQSSGLILGLADLGLSVGRSHARLRVVLPTAGDPVGLPGPARLNQDAIAIGQVVIIDDLHVALLPVSDGEVTRWCASPTDSDRQVPAVIRPEQASQAVKAALTTATAALRALDIAAGRDQVAGAISQINQRIQQVSLPPDLDGPSRHTIHTAAVTLGICEFARSFAPGATTAALQAERAKVLNELSTTARHCLAAAASPR